MPDNADAIAAYCRLLLETMPYSEVRAAVLAAEIKAAWLQDPLVTKQDIPVALLALSALSVMFDQYAEHIRRLKATRCPN